MDKPGSYWDYRDYIFSLCSSSGFRNQPIRLNIERESEWIDELKKAVKHYNFTDCVITQSIPKSWADYMLNQILANNTKWVMPFPGDHIYVNKDDNALIKYLDIAEKLNVDAVSYGHIQDWDYFIDWNKVIIEENNEDYIIIRWGFKYKYCRYKEIVKLGLKLFNHFLAMPPVPGFMIYRRDIMLDILNHLPKSSRWQDMEEVFCSTTYSYKVLIPKKYLYRHVHGYWLEHLFNLLSNYDYYSRLSRESILNYLYVRTNFDWKNNYPNKNDYFEKCLNKFDYLNKYTNSSNRINNYLENYSPFTVKKFNVTRGLFRNIYNWLVVNIYYRSKLSLFIIHRLIRYDK